MNKQNQKRPLKEVFLFLLDILYNAVIIVTLVVIIRSYIISPFRVVGSSMADTLVNNEFILIDKISYILGEPDRGDPIVFLPPISNKYPHKFQGNLTMDGEGKFSLDISDLKAPKKAFYCQNPIIQDLWLCQNKVNVSDLVFFKPVSDNGINSNLSWKSSNKQIVSAEEIQNESIEFRGEADTAYSFRVYDSTGPEYYVKRIIGIPGDTVKIENGRVYLKKEEDVDFVELSDDFLKEVNQGNTYFKKTPENENIVIPKGHFFVLGDNRSHSNDSRHWHTPIEEDYMPYVSKESISGRVLIVLWPPTNLRLLPSGIFE